MEKPDSSLLFRQPMYADKKQWKQFLSIFLLAAGVGFTVAGIIFFFAYNWEGLPKFAKLGIVQTLLVASVLLTVFTRWNILIKQIILTGATFLVGTLFAVFRTNLIRQALMRMTYFWLGALFHHPLGIRHPFHSALADVYRTALYYHMAIRYANSAG